MLDGEAFAVESFLKPSLPKMRKMFPLNAALVVERACVNTKVKIYCHHSLLKQKQVNFFANCNAEKWEKGLQKVE